MADRKMADTFKNTENSREQGRKTVKAFGQFMQRAGNVSGQASQAGGDEQFKATKPAAQEASAYLEKQFAAIFSDQNANTFGNR